MDDFYVKILSNKITQQAVPIHLILSKKFRLRSTEHLLIRSLHHQLCRSEGHCTTCHIGRPPSNCSDLGVACISGCKSFFSDPHRSINRGWFEYPETSWNFSWRGHLRCSATIWPLVQCTSLKARSQMTRLGGWESREIEAYGSQIKAVSYTHNYIVIYIILLVCHARHSVYVFVYIIHTCYIHINMICTVCTYIHVLLMHHQPSAAGKVSLCKPTAILSCTSQLSCQPSWRSWPEHSWTTCGWASCLISIRGWYAVGVKQQRQWWDIPPLIVFDS